MPFTRRLRGRPQAERTWRQRAEGAVSALPVSRAADVLSRRCFVALHRNGKPSGVIEAGRHCLPHAVCRTAVQEDKPTLRGNRECVEFDRERNSPFFNRFSAGNRPRHRCPRFVENDPYAIDNAQQSECPQPGQAPHTLPRERRLRLGPPKQTLPQISGIRMRLALGRPHRHDNRPSLRRSSFENAGHFTASLQEGTIRFPQRRTP